MFKYASNWDLPLIFYVINNKYGISMAQERCMRVKDITERAASYRIKGIHVEDGNDVLAVLRRNARSYRSR